MLIVDAIDVFYGPIQALRGVSLTVEDGQMVALVGANGAGKSTTLKAITGLVAPKRGSITFRDGTIDGRSPWDVVGLGIAHLPEGRELFPNLSVLDNLRLGNWAIRKNNRFDQRADIVMDHFPILRERSSQAAGTLSGGEQQMLGVARALMSDPKLLVVDELSLGLAPQIVTQLFDILIEINGEGTSVLLVEQFVHMALAHTHSAYVLAKGEVVLEGPSPELADDPALMEAYLGAEAAPKPATVGASGAATPNGAPKETAP